MELQLFWLVALGPMGLMALGLTPSRAADRHPKNTLHLAQGLSLLSILTAVGVMVIVGWQDPIRTPLFGVRGLGFSLYLDRISAPMFALVSFIGHIVIRYSLNYLDGDPGQGRFVKWISLTLGSVLFLIISGNLVQFCISWICTSLSLHQLLIFYPERPAAILAARKKWVVSRLGDLCLIAAMIIIYQSIGSLDYVSIFQTAMDSTKEPFQSALPWAAVFLAGAALLKSAQLPIHGWLLEVMETPTPVSALLHAGIINAGGFLVIRFSHLVALSPVAMTSMLLIGAATALFGSVVMLTQTSVKVSLAYSTIAQMGFMMLECGLGVFSAAMLHILAHSAYKAHAFLSSGSAVELAQLQPKNGSDQATANLTRLLPFTGMAMAAVLAIGLLFQLSPAKIALGCIFSLGGASLLSSGFGKNLSWPFSLRIVARVIGTSLLFCAVQNLAEWVFASSLAPELTTPSLFEIVILTTLVLLFATVSLMQKILVFRNSDQWLALHTHIANGFYINTIANRLVIRLWPSPAPRSSRPSYIPSFEGGTKS